MRFMLSTLVVLSLAFVGCGKKDDGGGGSGDGVIATTPSNCTLGGTQTPTGQCFGQYSQFNASYGYIGTNPVFMDYQQLPSGGYCGCQSGYNAIYHAQWGMGCVNSGYLPQMSQGQYFPSWSWNNNQWVNIPQSTYQPVTGCYQNVMQACNVQVANACGTYGYCRPVGGGSTVGTCVYTYTQGPFHPQTTSGSGPYGGVGFGM